MDDGAPPFSSMPTLVGLVEKGKRIKMAAEVGLARSSRGRHWGRALRRRLRKGTTMTMLSTAGCPCRRNELPLTSSSAATVKVEEKEWRMQGDEDIEEEVEGRVRSLQRLVPGGEELEVERLFEETADYIEALQQQVTAMRALACLLDGLEREKTMMPGG
ncbi:hypothetical protein Cni_G29425 [Canna indica]|uniref:Uncharacterized protein n=1 Tax=Canna indica TaxID=4628 RepID=A0AAQ3L5E8_9LILI|nr:hypothetical protein Cni_G29425 [Canna indica]